MFSNLKNQLKNNHLLRSGILVFVLGNFINLLNYVFNLVMARMVSIEVFGEIATLFSLFMILNIPATFLTVYISNKIASSKEDEQRDLLVVFAKQVFSFSILAFFIFLIFVPVLSSIFKLESVDLLVFAIFMPLVIWSAYIVGFFQGKHWFLNSSLVGVILVVGKLIFSILFVYLGFSLLGIIFALQLSYVIVFIFARATFKNFIKNLRGINILDFSYLKIFRNHIFLSSLFITIFGNVDILFAKYFLQTGEVGAYAALSLTSKIILFATASFSNVMMPLASRAHTEGSEHSQKLFFQTLFFTFLVGFPITFLFILFPEFSLSYIFGKKFISYSSYLYLFSLATFTAAFVGVFVNYFIASKDKLFVYFLGCGVLIQVLLLCYTHTSLRGLVLAVLFSNITILALLFARFVFKHKN